MSEKRFHVSEETLNFLSSRITNTALLEAFRLAKQKGQIESLSTMKLFPVSLSPIQRDELEDCLLNLLGDAGIDNSGEPSAMGYYLEGLINAFTAD